MWTEPKVTAAPATEPVSLAEAKAHVRVTSSDHDTVLGIYITAARQFVENYTGLKLVEQTVQFSRRNFRLHMPLPVAPIQSLSISYVDPDEATQTLATSTYQVEGLNTLRPVLHKDPDANWPDLDDGPEVITVEAVVGFTTMPEDLKNAMLLLIATWFDRRETAVIGGAVEAPFAATALLENYRTF